MKNKIIIISLLSLAIVSLVAYSIISNNNQTTNQIQNNEQLAEENNKEEVKEDINKKEEVGDNVTLPEIELTFDDDGSDSVFSKEDTDPFEDIPNQQPSQQTPDNNKAEEKEYITIEDDDRITVNDDGSISIDFSGNSDNKTQLIFD